MSTQSENSREPSAGGVKPSPVTAMGPTYEEWGAWTSEVKTAYLRAYCEAELFYRGVISFQWKGNFGPALDRAIAHLDYHWPNPSRSFSEEYGEIISFYQDPKNQHIGLSPARRCVLMQIAGYSPSVVQESILKIRNKAYERVDPRDRILRQRHPSLAELEQLSSTRALDENELWIRAQLTASEKGTDAALPLLNSFIADHPVHDKALFLRGRLLLAKNDSAGIVDLERVVELDPESLADAYELIAAFHFRKHDPEAAEDFAALARRWRTIQEAAEFERVSVENGDELAPHELSEEVLVVVRNQLQRFPEIAACYLARKVVKLFVDRHFYLLGLVIDAVPTGEDAERVSTDLIVNIQTQIVLPERTYLVVFDEGTRVLREKVQALPAAELYCRGGGAANTGEHT